jgi:sulfur carrier protein
MMEVVANGEPVAVAADATIADLLAQLGLGARWVVVERNGDPVARAELSRTRLTQGDRLELVRAVAGG